MIKKKKLRSCLKIKKKKLKKLFIEMLIQQGEMKLKQHGK